MTSTGASAPRRKAEISTLRRLSRNVLIIGTVIAVLAAFGPVWVVRIGVVVAVGAAVAASVFAWRELAEARRQHAQEMVAASRAHGAALREERVQNASVVEALSERVQHAVAEIARSRRTVSELTATVTELDGVVADLRGQLSTLHGDHAAAQDGIREREGIIASLRDIISAREADLVAMSQARNQVRSMPRRMLVEAEEAWESLPEAEDLWSGDRHPTVAELADVAVVLPNYEGERKLA